MQITTIKTGRVTARSSTLIKLLDQHLEIFYDSSILAITSKIVSLCEGSTVPIGTITKEDLVIQQSNHYLPSTYSKHGFHFTITNNTLIPMAGIDESNTGGCYVLWPQSAQQTANEVREYLCHRFSIKHAGVIITDSTCQPMRRGTSGICLAHSGFAALNDYVGKDDLFGRPMRVTQSSISEGLSAAAVACMGEGSEQTPIAVISDTTFVTFQDRNPTAAELQLLAIPLQDDLFAPFLNSVEWKNGKTEVGSIHYGPDR